MIFTDSQDFYRKIIEYFLKKAIADGTFTSKKGPILLHDDISNLYHVTKIAKGPKDFETAKELSKMERSGEFGTLRTNLKRLLNNLD